VRLTDFKVLTFDCYGTLIGVAFAAVYTAEEIGSYKPDLKNFAT
jgi:FMN phosphatase YigB (HAD superfamily)